MAIEAKADFLRQLEAELSASIPAAQLSVVLAAASVVLLLLSIFCGLAAATVFGVATMPWWA